MLFVKLTTKVENPTKLPLLLPKTTKEKEIPEEANVLTPIVIYGINNRSLVLTLDNNGAFHRKGEYSKSIRMDEIQFTGSIDCTTLSDSAKKSLLVDNAGGKSAVSEAFSIYYFGWIRGATDFVFEKEVDYWISYKMVDFICTVKGKRVGVSVTRAMGFPSPNYFGYDDAVILLRKKLFGLIVARDCVMTKHSFSCSVLHVWCQTEAIANHVRDAYSSFDVKDFGLDVASHVLLMLTVCGERMIYSETKNDIYNLVKDYV